MIVNFVQPQPFYSSTTEPEQTTEELAPEVGAAEVINEENTEPASAIGLALLQALEKVEIVGEHAAPPIVVETPPSVPATPVFTPANVFGGNMSQLTKVSIALFFTLDLSSRETFDPALKTHTYAYRGDDVVTNMFDPFKRDQKTEVTGIVRQSLKGLFAVADMIGGNQVMYFGDDKTIAAQIDLLAENVKNELGKAFIGFTPSTPVFEEKTFSDFVTVDTWSAVDTPENGLPEQVVYANITVRSGAILGAETPHAYIDRAINTLKRAAQEVSTPVYVSVALRSTDLLSDPRIEDAAKIISDKLGFDVISRMDVAEGIAWVNEKLFPATADVSLYRALLEDAEPAASETPAQE